MTPPATTVVSAPGADLGRRFVEALVRADFDGMASLLHPEVQFRGLSPHKFLKNRRSDPAGGVIRAFRLWFYEGAGGAYEGDHPVGLLSCSTVPFGGGGRYKLSYRVRAKSREMVEQFQPLVPVATAQGRPETAARQIVL